MLLERVNLHHLHYFWAVATDGNLTRASLRLRTSQSAVSAQVRLLEQWLGVDLFRRTGRTLVLTEAGRLALGYAQQIFSTADSMVSSLKEGRGIDQALRVGSVATLSRNFQELFLHPVLRRPDVPLILRSGSQPELLALLERRELDVVLDNRKAPTRSGALWRCLRIARQSVSLVGRKRLRARPMPDLLRAATLIVPGADSEIRSEFDAICAAWQIVPRIVAEVDDMALMRLLARDTEALTVLPSVVVRDELEGGSLREYGAIPGLFETFYAITVARDYPHPLLGLLLARDSEAILQPPKPAVHARVQR